MGTQAVLGAHADWLGVSAPVQVCAAVAHDVAGRRVWRRAWRMARVAACGGDARVAAHMACGGACGGVWRRRVWRQWPVRRRRPWRVIRPLSCVGVARGRLQQ
eukprot:5066194-Prymnesium_polylepis.1